MSHKTRINNSKADKGREYNKNCALYPRPLTCQKEYMCQLWALHIIIKRVFTFISQGTAWGLHGKFCISWPTWT